VYPGICLTTEEEALKNFSQGSEKPHSGYVIYQLFGIYGKAKTYKK
jgi:hypothetical protein